ncbi:IPT/TIG domain-containing protein [Pontibacter sp. SGAir0037]|uniref:IPT/TIG domain-containing protein n=1 Tax=Pontibacter sp. SGAir0037 TaxID=2571030 RepID=UPI0010CCD5B9|nr:IPT/TIG domain-containing protein [Pontibacter sp. SGAir0037]QCR23881.1 hypothetical protein C1N53_17025 [Pontibacter sp. SGAir0037]
MTNFYNAPALHRQLTTGALFLLLLLLSVRSFSNDIAHMVPVSLEEKTRQAQIIVEGEVISKKSFWDDQHRNIYTSHTIKVYKVFKGTVREEYVELVTEGGTVDLKMHVFSNALKLKEKQQGVFFLTEQQKHKISNHQIAAKAVADQQGFIEYNLRNGAAKDPFNTFDSVNEVYNAITAKTGTTYKVITENVQLRTITSAAQTEQQEALAAPAITSFSPTTASAGTGTVLTINGSGFGAQRGNGSVQFRNADDGGRTFVRPLENDYVSWSNTKIEVRVPSTTEDEGGTAGTGQIRVVAADGTTTTSTTPLTVPYSYINIEYNGRSAQPILVGMNQSSGYTVSFAPSMRRTSVPQEGFRRAMNSWICSTKVNWRLDAGTTLDQATDDGLSIIRFAPASEVGTSTLARTISRYQGCGTTNNIQWSVSEFDMEINSGINWQYGPGAPTGNQYDFETVVLHELGHAHQLGHVILERNAVMHYAVANSVQYRDLSANDIEGANLIISYSLNPTRATAASRCVREDGQSIRPFALRTDGDCSVASEVLAFNAAFNPSGGAFGGTTSVTWTLQTVNNITSFEVQRSENGTDWEGIGTVNATGALNYTFTDDEPLPEISYYRLQIRYSNGDPMYSYRVRVINSSVLGTLAVYPNPYNPNTSTNMLQLRYIVWESTTMNIQLYDYTGRLHKDFIVTFGDAGDPVTVDIDDLAAGMYILKWSAGNRRGETKVVKL